ncbi:MAG: FAD-dependent oxidoreductase [Gammaproteobacteria bacterium]|nr:FAD-dependent oxidoreductase [Gammaproteobacteria bacterium]
MPIPLDLLPAWLRERSLALNDQGAKPERPRVLYWMRVAMRSQDNPALEAALTLAHALDRPLLVYQGLSERYPFASDRHHRFILEGARDVASALAERGVAYAFHLERPDHRGDHLLQLAAESAAVVTEIFPWKPLADWTSTLARRADCGVLAVDSSCLVPMPRVDARSCDRAFRFRDATASLRRRALEAPPFESLPAVPGDLPDLPFEPVDLEQADLAALIASCHIDHTVAPVPHTPGGSRAAETRWQSFRDQRLVRYHRQRNDPLADGVSRLSAYLHYGQISPFRIAREAAAQGGAGAEKFLDELLVWRELAWAFCFHHPQHEQLSVLPEWARATLEVHRQDRRPVLHDWETLARGRSGDALWDAAQRSLRIHGELHNNVRMTWGKALLAWTPDAGTALARLIDLNHRYALDGRDPNSYAGILWCLGLFDRPFQPEQPILGSVRGRDTRHHASRLDVSAYGALTRRSALDAPPTVAVIGAGIGGLFAARTLMDHGLTIDVMDKGRRPGGRCATRTSRHAAGVGFDHGVPAFTLSDRRLAPHAEAWEERGLMRRWLPREGDALWVPVPDANALARHLAAGLAPRLNCEVTRIIREQGQWQLFAGKERVAGPCEALLLNMPPAQAARLLATTEQSDLLAVADDLAKTAMAPAWAVMVKTEAGFDPGFDLLRPPTGPIDLACREAAKPGRPDQGCFTFHATAAFSIDHLDASAESVAILLAPAVSQLLETSILPHDLHCHRWRYAQSTGLADDPFSQPAIGLYFCGDWLSTPGGIEGALLSGSAAAGRLLGAPPEGPTNRRPPEQASLF